MKYIRTAFAAFLAILSMTVNAQTYNLGVLGGTPDAGSLYTTMIGEATRACPKTSVGTVTPLPGGGSLDNMLKLSANGAGAGIVQLDIFMLYGQRDPAVVGNLGVLFLLHPEAYTMISPVSVKSGFMSTKPVRTVEDLVGKKIAVTASGALSLAYMSHVTGLQYEAVTAANAGAALKLLAEGKVGAAMVVTGIGNSAIAEFARATQGQFMVVPFSEPTIAKMEQNGYTRQTVTYSGAGTAVVAATRAAVVAQRFNSETRRRALDEWRKCVRTSVGDIRDDAGVSRPSWSAASLQNGAGQYSWDAVK